MSVSSVNVPNTGSAPIAVISDGTQSHSVSICEFLPNAGSTSPVQVDNQANPLPASVASRLIIPAAAQFTRPANTTAYAVGNAVANSTTAGSVTALSFTIADVNNAPAIISRARLYTSDTGVVTPQAAFRLLLFAASSVTVAHGDGASFSTSGVASFIGSLTGSMVHAFTDGTMAFLTSEDGPYIITTPVASGTTIIGFLQALTAFTPQSASTWNCSLEVERGRG